MQGSCALEVLKSCCEMQEVCPMYPDCQLDTPHLCSWLLLQCKDQGQCQQQGRSSWSPFLCCPHCRNRDCPALPRGAAGNR